MNDIECVLDDSTRHERLTSVVSYAHEATYEPFDNGIDAFVESFHLVAVGG